MATVFLSHTSDDKPFVRKLAHDLESQGISYWLDEAEIKIGDSLIDKIREGIDTVDYLVVVLSPKSIESSWVNREVDVALNQEIGGKKIKVLPIMYQKCDEPGFLLGKNYGDFTDASTYPLAFRSLVESLGHVFNNSAFESKPSQATLSTAIDSAVYNNLRIMSKPFHRPFQYIGLQIYQAARAVDSEANDVGNIVVEDRNCRMLLEAEGNFISFIEVEIKQTIPTYQHQTFNPEQMLGVLSVSPSELELIRHSTYCHTYYDHRRKLKVDVMCAYDGGPISVSFGTKYYGE